MAVNGGFSEGGGTHFSPVARWSCGLVGVVAATVGAVAVFTTNNGAGTTALIAAGVVLAVVAVNGVPIHRMRLGDAEVAFASLAQRANEAKSQGDNEEAQHLWEESLHLARARFGILSDPDEYSATATSVINSLSDRWNVYPTPSGRSPVPIIDAIVQAGDRRIGLAVRAGPNFSANAVVTSLELAMENAALRLNGFLVVVNCNQSEEKLRYFRDLSETRHVLAVPVGWRIGDPPRRLQEALEELLSPVPATRTEPKPKSPSARRRRSGLGTDPSGEARESVNAAGTDSARARKRESPTPLRRARSSQEPDGASRGSQ